MIHGDVLHGHEPDLQAVVLGGGVEPLDQVLDLRHVGTPGDHRQRIGLAIHFQDGLFSPGSIFIDSGHFHADIGGACVLQPDKLNVAIGTFRCLIQRGKQLLDELEVGGRCRNEQAVGAWIDGDGRLGA